ncbi:hypothetical protein PAEVO_31070 [Paenibacillus sp. GM2FR]|uniref:glycosyltransferase family 2 protein n=1 Tax=Paenibacillus sp. GM2FR TaxID=2059268 RepID=UPI000C27D282|nr:glycosyltransferase [Paenibacillus sp. GM2FR]PJN56384.1 hypothetical protein PAEVO_31070 [Paenibacillus sp. GM2FR]
MLPRVSVIIPFYNCSYVQQAVESALAQTYPEMEVIVVDDGSSEHMDLLTPYIDRIRYIRKINGGTASALNAGIREAKGDYIAWLSSDDYYLPNKIARQISFMLQRGAWISSTNFNFVNERNIVLQEAPNFSFSSTMELLDRLKTACPINGCTTMMKRHLFEKVGMFNEKIKYTQDYDMWCRVVLTGYEFHYLHDILLHYRYHPNMGTLKHQNALKQEFAALQAIYSDRLEQRRQVLLTGGRKP